ncbi:hypothetical protein, partial [Paralimibaculum aggregatum]|uniref:hypothetical protein n=1 Tax=Paralimibaculum aggregatum TaxID=3036245 RepID=UPI002553B674
MYINVYIAFRHVYIKTVSEYNLSATTEAVLDKLSELGNLQVEPEVELKPEVPIKKSVQDDH